MTLLFAVLTAVAQDACPEGMQRAGLEQPQCCWPGQTWTGTACTGIPQCPDGMRTTPQGCTDKPAPAPKPVAERRLVQFSGFGGSRLYVDDEEIGRLPASLELTLGEHTWRVNDLAGNETATGTFKTRRGDGVQILVLEPAPPTKEERARMEDIRPETPTSPEEP